MSMYDASLQTRQCRNPSATNRPVIMVHYPTHRPCSAHTSLLLGVSPMDERLAQTCFSLGLLGLGQAQTSQVSIAQIPTLQNPNPQNPPELDHLLPNTTTTPTRLINPQTISSYRLTTLQATKNPLSPNLHNPRFSLNLSTPQPHPFPPLSRPIILLSHTTTRTTAKSKSETMRTPSHHHRFTRL